MDPKIIFIGLINPEGTDFDLNHQKELESYTNYIKSYNKTRAVYISQKVFLCMYISTTLSSSFKGDLKILTTSTFPKDQSYHHISLEFSELPSSLDISKPSQIIKFFKQDYDLIIFIVDQNIFESFSLMSITRRFELSLYHELQTDTASRRVEESSIKTFKSELSKLQQSCQSSIDEMLQKFEILNEYLFRVPEEIKVISKSLDGKFKLKQENILENTKKALSESESVFKKIENLADIADKFKELTQLYVLHEPSPPDLQVMVKSINLGRSLGKMKVKLVNPTHYNFKKVKLFICESQEELATVTYFQSLSSVKLETELKEEFFYKHLLAVSGSSPICEPFLILPLKIKKSQFNEHNISIINLSQETMTGVEIVSPDSIQKLLRINQDLQPGNSYSILFNYEAEIKSILAIFKRRQASNFLELNE